MELQPIENPIVIHPHLLQRFLKHGKDYANLLALYSFYLYHAQQQKTNQPLATDEFTSRGMNWASDRVKKTKKILKEMKVIEVIQKQKYYYVRLFFIYTKKKIGEILGNAKESQKDSKTEASAPKSKPQEEKKVEKKEEKKETTETKTLVQTIPIFTTWLEYCDKNSIKYTKNSLKHWEDKLKNRVAIDQEEAIYNAINKKWKNFYITPLKESKYHKFLGKSLMMEKDCDTLLNLAHRDNKYIYQFKNTKVTSTASPSQLFTKYGYEKSEVKTAPIASVVKDKIMGLVKRF